MKAESEKGLSDNSFSESLWLVAKSFTTPSGASVILLIITHIINK